CHQRRGDGRCDIPAGSHLESWGANTEYCPLPYSHTCTTPKSPRERPARSTRPVKRPSGLTRTACPDQTRQNFFQGFFGTFACPGSLCSIERNGDLFLCPSR